MPTTKTDILLHQLAVTSGAALVAKTGAKIFEFDVPADATSAASTGYFEFTAAASAAATVEIAAEGAFANTAIALAPKGTGEVRVLGNSTSSGGIRFYEDTDNGENYTGIRASIMSAAGSYTLTLPKSAGTAGYALCLDGTNVTNPLQWKEALVDGGSFDALTLGSLNAGLIEIDSDSAARLLFDTNDDDKWVLGVQGNDGGIFRINAATSGATQLSAGFLFQLETSGAAHVRKSLHVGANSAGSAQGTASLVAATAASAAFLRLAEDTDAGSNFAFIKPAALGADTYFTLPNFGAPAQFIVGSTAQTLPRDMVANANFTIDGASAGSDITLALAEDATIKFSIGIDGSDSDKFKIHSGNSGLVDDSDLEIDASGNVAIKNGTLTVTNNARFEARAEALATSAGFAAVGSLGLHLKGSNSAGSTVVFSEDTGNGTNKLKLAGPRLLAANQIATIPNTGGDIMTAASMVWAEQPAAAADGTRNEFVFSKQASLNGGAMVFRNGVMALPTGPGQHVIGKAFAGSAAGIRLATSAGAYQQYGEFNAPSGTNDFFNGWQILIVDGKGRGEHVTITDYDGTSKQAKVGPSWTSAGVVPDATSVYVLVQNDYSFIAKHNNSTTGTAVAYFAKDNQDTLPQSGDVIFATYQRLASSVA